MHLRQPASSEPSWHCWILSHRWLSGMQMRVSRHSNCVSGEHAVWEHAVSGNHVNCHVQYANFKLSNAEIMNHHHKSSFQYRQARYCYATGLLPLATTTVFKFKAIIQQYSLSTHSSISGEHLCVNSTQDTRSASSSYGLILRQRESRKTTN